ncbi:MAG: glycosyltransferase [Candidatus Cloacimonetes bacterium]|nr:glycosyltransferase [Candidatus Cloacimonadota bacterium]
MQKILYLTPYLPYPNSRAANLFISKRISLLAKRFQVHLVSITNGEKPQHTETTSRHPDLTSCKIFTRKNLSLISALQSAIQQEHPFNLLFPEMIEYVKRKSANFDYILIDHSYFAEYVIRKANLHDSKTVVIYHNIEKDYFKYIYHSTSFKNPKKLYYLLSYLATKKRERELESYKLNAKWFLSETDYEFVQGGSKLYTPSIKFTPTLNDEEMQITHSINYFGQLDNDRNIDGLQWFISKVLPLLPKKVVFQIAGRNPSNRLKQMISTRNNIKLIGEIHDLQTYFSQNKLFIIPLFSTIGVQTKLFESLSNNALIICTKDVARGTPFKNNQHLLESNEPEEYANLIVHAMQNFNSLYSKFQKNISEISSNELSDKQLLTDMETNLDKL